MKKRLTGLVWLVCVMLGATLMHGCPGSSAGLYLAWLVNATQDTTFTHFVRDRVDNQNVLVELDEPIAPGEAVRFRFDNAFRASVVRVGLSGDSETGTSHSSHLPNNGMFGYGGTDVFVAYQNGTFFDARWTKEPT